MLLCQSRIPILSRDKVVTTWGRMHYHRGSQHTDFLVLAVSISMDFNSLKETLLTGPYTKQIMEKVTTTPSATSEFQVVDQHLFYKSRLVIPNLPLLKDNILNKAHITPTVWHGGCLKMLKRVTTSFYWPRMKHDIKTFVQNCLTCQQIKYQTLAPGDLLQPLPLPKRVWENFSLFIVWLPKSRGYATILVVVDRFSKYAHFLLLSHLFIVKFVVNLLCKEIVHLHGIPWSILSDWDVVFLSSFWQKLFWLSQTQIQMGTLYHPQSDGQTKVVKRCLETCLRCFAHEHPKLWSWYICWAEFSYNTSFHSFT